MIRLPKPPGDIVPLTETCEDSDLSFCQLDRIGRKLMDRIFTLFRFCLSLLLVSLYVMCYQLDIFTQ